MSDFAHRLRKNWSHLRKWARREGITAFRVYDRDIPAWRFAVDWYAGRALVTEYSRRRGAAGDVEVERAEVLRAVEDVLEAGPERIVVKTREPKPWRREQYLALGEGGERFEVEQRGLRFLVNLTDRIDTGLFLDHRDTWARVRAEAAGTRFLNLFCYTGAFTVHAAAGGAESTTSVDLSNTALDWTGANLRLNGFSGPRHELVRSDVTRWLGQVRGRRWSLAVLDPPSYSISKRMAGSLQLQRDHATLVRATLELLDEGGALYFSTNFRGFRLDPEAFAGCSDVRELTPRSIPPDFHDRAIHRCWRAVKGSASFSATITRGMRGTHGRRD